MKTETPSTITIVVRDIAGTHQTNTVRGKRASATSGYQAAAELLARKLYPEATLLLKPVSIECGKRVFELVVPE